MEGFLDGLTGDDSVQDTSAESWTRCLEGRLVERWISSAFFGILIVILLAAFLRS